MNRFDIFLGIFRVRQGLTRAEVESLCAKNRWLIHKIERIGGHTFEVRVLPSR